MDDKRIYVDYAFDLEQDIVVPGGFVELVDVYGSDTKPAEVARIAYKRGDKVNVRKDQKLVEYLLKNKHTSPFEFVEAEFVMRMPLFVARQLFRHRTASVNEMSMRYSTALPLVWLPDTFRVQDTVNKQGSFGVNDNNDDLKSAYLASVRESYAAYTQLLAGGAPKEQARAVLPVGMYTEVRWKQDFKNLSHLLTLRLDSHAQFETRLYAGAMLVLLQTRLPLLKTLLDDYMFSTYTLTLHEVQTLLAASAKNDPTIISGAIKSKSAAKKLLNIFQTEPGEDHPLLEEIKDIERLVKERNMAITRTGAQGD